MKFKILLASIIGIILFQVSFVQAQVGVENPAASDDASEILPNPPSVVDVVYRAKIVGIIEEGQQTDESGVSQPYQKLEVKILNGNEKGKHVVVDNGVSFVIGEFQKFKKGDVVVLTKPAASPKKDFYYITDIYRVNKLIFIILLFFALAILFGRKKGFTSMVGMLFSVVVIFYFLIPRIVDGGNPLITTLVASFFIMILSLYLAHGLNKRTSIALISGMITLVFTVIIDIFFVKITHLSGLGTEEAFYLQLDNIHLDLKSLLLSGIIIGVLGVLDDVTTAQAATVEELHEANPALSFIELYKRGISVGKEHIASLVNTLVLAYVGVSFPLILLFTVSRNQPMWVIFNSNLIAEEVVRTIVGSCALILAVPITTFLAARFFGTMDKNKEELSHNNNSSRDEKITGLWNKE